MSIDEEFLAERIAEAEAFMEDRTPYRELQPGYGLWVVPMLFNYRICIGPIDSAQYDDAWCYQTRELAERAADEWDPKTSPEPSYWHKHPTTGRRSPTEPRPDQGAP